MWNKRIKAGLLSLLIMTSLLSGCGKKEEAEPAPELLEPLSVSQSFRPVERRRVGSVEYLQGRVLPMEYAHFFAASTAVSEILVDYGDEVKAGDVIARADVSIQEEKVKSLNSSIAAENANASFAKREYEALVNRLSCDKAAADAVGDTETSNAVQKQLEVEAENYRFQSAQSAQTLSRLGEDLAKAKAEVEKGTLTARHDGTVTYVADVSKSWGLNGPEEVLVLISDYHDLFIEATHNVGGKEKLLSTKEYIYRGYEDKYTMIGGQKYDIREMDYTAQEQRMVKIREAYPGMRFRAEGAPLTAGTNIPLYFAWKETGEVLTVGLDSIQTEGETSYVYVRKSEGSDDLEKRVVEIGEKDNLYAEVLSGLEEGEDVYYDSGSVLPSRFEPEEVQMGTFVKTSVSEHFSAVNTKLKFYYTPQVPCLITGGTTFWENDFVSEGDILFSYTTATKESELLEASQAISAEKRRHAEAVDQLNRELAQLDQDIAAAPDTKTLLESDFMTATDTDAQEKEEILYSKEKLSADRVQTGIRLEQENASYSQTLGELEKEYARLQSISGETEVKATGSGVIKYYVNFYGDYPSEPNALMAVVAEPRNPLVEVTMMPVTSKGASAVEKLNAGGDTAALPGQKVTLETEEGTYELTCEGYNGDDEKIYVTSIGEKVYMPKAVKRADSQYPVFYASPEAELPEEMKGVVSFDSVAIPNVLTVPTEAVYTEKSAKTNKTLHYVWRIMPYGLDKTYVDVEIGSRTTMVLAGLSEHDQVAVEVLEQ